MRTQRRKILWRIYPSYLVLTAVLLSAVVLFASGTFKKIYLEKTGDDLYEMAMIVEKVVSADIVAGRLDGLDKSAKLFGDRPHVRITFITPEGVVVGDSLEDPAKMENHADRPEVASALAGAPGRSMRFSHTVGESMMYVAVPVMDGASVAGVVRTAVSVASIDASLGEFYRKASYGGLAAVFLAAAVGLIVSRRLTDPLVALEKGARRMAEGELTARLPLADTDEIASLTEAMNEMAARLDDRINFVTRQKNEQDAILSGMVEGVIAVDTAGRVIIMNQAAAELLAADRIGARGRGLQEVVRNTELTAFMERALGSDAPVEGELVLRGQQERFLSATGTKLVDRSGAPIGALLVLNDTTRLRKLENIRRDFVANVSHELRTPITAIKGYAETLVDGGLDDPDAATRFLDGIVSQSNRLNGIIDDLLSLSNIERLEESDRVQLQDCPVKAVLETAISTCEFDADARDIDIELACSEDITARINPQLMEQAVINLVVNAVKYSEPGTPVVVSCAREDDGVAIKVADRGCGIDEKHFPRLFERFYRVDRARSRAAGGTGLGLSIVKHIVQAHGGSVSVESAPGRGSTFTIHIP